MDLKERIGTFINQILMAYGLNQADLARTLGVGLASLSAYLKGKELPRVDILLKLSEMGGITMDELLKTDKSPQKKEISITINTGDGSPVSGVTAHGDIYQNTTVRRIYKYNYQPGDLMEEQAARLQKLVDDIVGLESAVKRTPKSHAAIWNALKRKFKVAYYRKISEEDFPKAELYLMMWKGRLTKPLRKKEPASYRKSRYAAIFSAAKNQLGWSKQEVDNLIFAEYEVPSIRNLTDDQLENLYNRIMGLKKKFR